MAEKAMQALSQSESLGVENGLSQITSTNSMLEIVMDGADNLEQATSDVHLNSIDGKNLTVHQNLCYCRVFNCHIKL